MHDVVHSSQLQTLVSLFSRRFMPMVNTAITVDSNSFRNAHVELLIACQPLLPSTHPFCLKRNSLGPFTIQFPFCRALHWIEERLTSRGSARSPKFGMCCNSGKISCPVMPDPQYRCNLYWTVTTPATVHRLCL
jgi:hypothetical protein